MMSWVMHMALGLVPWPSTVVLKLVPLYIIKTSLGQHFILLWAPKTCQFWIKAKPQTHTCHTSPYLRNINVQLCKKKCCRGESLSPGYREEDYEGSFLVRWGKGWRADRGAKLPAFESRSITVTSNALFITAWCTSHLVSWETCETE